jgi:hypothetical protein
MEAEIHAKTIVTIYQITKWLLFKITTVTTSFLKWIVSIPAKVHTRSSLNASQK